MLALHITLTLISVSGFVLRAGWSLTDRAMLDRKLVRIFPHIIDTLLLLTGVLLAFDLPDGLLTDWLLAKLIALVGYIGFGVVALRATGSKRWIGIVGALVCVCYIYLVAVNRSVLFF